MSASAELPLFPLNTVLFPGGPLPLRIFEPRYIDMVRHCMRTQSGFGVVAIRSGAEAGVTASIASIGCSARIVDFDSLPDGLLGIMCRGERKFRVLRRWRREDGLNVGAVAWCEPEPEIELPPEYRFLADVLRRVLPELGDLYRDIETRFADAGWVGSRLVELVPLELADKQVCLEFDDPLERIARIAPLIKRPGEA
jgi:Lon protease-like protein